MPSRSFWNFSAKLQTAFRAPNFRLSRTLRLWRPCSVKTSAKLLRRATSQFATLCEAALQRGLQVRFLAHGQSMQPNVLNGDAVIAEPVAASELRRGDIALTLGAHGVLLHRVIGLDPKTNRIVTRGDAGQQDDTAAALNKIAARIPQAIPPRNPGWCEPFATFARHAGSAAVRPLRVVPVRVACCRAIYYH